MLLCALGLKKIENTLKCVCVCHSTAYLTRSGIFRIDPQLVPCLRWVALLLILRMAVGLAHRFLVVNLIPASHPATRGLGLQTQDTVLNFYIGAWDSNSSIRTDTTSLSPLSHLPGPKKCF